MKIKILPSASEDLLDGYWFYQRQEEGLGRYFLNVVEDDYVIVKAVLDCRKNPKSIKRRLKS